MAHAFFVDGFHNLYRKKKEMKEYVWDKGENKRRVMAPTRRDKHDELMACRSPPARKCLTATSSLLLVCEHRRTLFLATCRTQCLIVSRFPEYLLGLCSVKEENIAFVQEEKHFYKVMDR